MRTFVVCSAVVLFAFTRFAEAQDKAVPDGSSGVVTQRDGSVLKGQLLGTLVLAKGPMLAVIEGKDVASIDQGGVRLRPKSLIVQAGMPLSTRPEVFRNAKPEDILKVVLPAAEKIETNNAFVGNISGAVGMAMMMGGDANDARLVWVSFDGERAYVLKRLDEEAPRP